MRLVLCFKGKRYHRKDIFVSIHSSQAHLEAKQIKTGPRESDSAVAIA